jgi:hypothetical protein
MSPAFTDAGPFFEVDDLQRGSDVRVILGARAA